MNIEHMQATETNSGDSKRRFATSQLREMDTI